jgi:transcriptional regulator with AAA-type ATPase domain
VVISGEPGLESDNLAALIHFGSPARRQWLVTA